jgi:tetratricopeptide (TPR) repeat protein
LLAPYRVRYAVIYTGSKCWHADCYGDYRFPTDGALFAKTFPVVYRNTGYSVYELAGHAPALSREFVQRVFRVCTEPGDSDIAIMECSRVLAAHGALSSSQVPDALIARADAYVEQGDIRRAAADYREAARLRPRDPRALEGAGRQALAAGDWAAAVRWFARALAIRPGDPDLHYLRGSALLQGARYHEAIREFDRTVALMPDYGMAYYERAQAEKAIDLAPAALADLRRTLEVNPNITAARADLRALLSEAR